MVPRLGITFSQVVYPKSIFWRIPRGHALRTLILAVITEIDFETCQATLRSFHPEADNSKRIDFHNPPIVMPPAQLPLQ